MSSEKTQFFNWYRVNNVNLCLKNKDYRKEVISLYSRNTHSIITGSQEKHVSNPERATSNAIAITKKQDSKQRKNTINEPKKF